MFTARSQTKQAIETVKAQVIQSADDNETRVTLNKQNWELISKKLEGETWKDEFVTIVLYTPLVMLMLGALLDPDRTLIQSAHFVMNEINQLNTDSGYGKLLFYVTLAALSIKAVLKR